MAVVECYGGKQITVNLIILEELHILLEVCIHDYRELCVAQWFLGEQRPACLHMRLPKPIDNGRKSSFDKTLQLFSAENLSARVLVAETKQNIDFWNVFCFLSEDSDRVGIFH